MAVVVAPQKDFKLAITITALICSQLTSDCVVPLIQGMWQKISGSLSLSLGHMNTDTALAVALWHSGNSNPRLPQLGGSTQL